MDEDVPFSYLLGMVWSKCISALYGMLRLQTCKVAFVHPTARIKCASKFHFGKGLNIGYRCYINALSKEGLTVGDNVSMGMYTTVRLTGSLKQIANYVRIGNNVGLGTHSYYGCGVGFLEIGDNTIFGNYVSVHPENHNYNDITTPIREQGVTGKGIIIGANCWIGAKATILDGTRLGNGCIVAAGAVVKGEFPDNSIIGGVPAKIIKMR